MKQLLNTATAFILIATIATGFQNCSNKAFSEMPEEQIPIPQSISVDCGHHAEGDMWEELDGVSVVTAPTCPTQKNTYQKHTMFQCVNGAPVDQGSRVGQLLSTSGRACLTPGPNPTPNPTPGPTLPPVVTPASCNGLPHGSKRWEAFGQEQVLVRTCTNGTKMYDVYGREREVVCQNGVVSATGRTRRGALLSAAGACPVEQVKCPGNYSEGQLKRLTEGTILETRPCSQGQTGEIKETYARINTYKCVSGSFKYMNYQKGALISATAACQSSTRPDHCYDTHHSVICDAYMYFFNRWPENAGAVYWAGRFTSEGKPTACWYREISKGTTGGDCISHYNKFGFLPNSGQCTQPYTKRDAPRAVKTAQCQ